MSGSGYNFTGLSEQMVGIEACRFTVNFSHFPPTYQHESNLFYLLGTHSRTNQTSAEEGALNNKIFDFKKSSLALVDNQEFGDGTVPIDSDDYVIDSISQKPPRSIGEFHRDRHARKHVPEYHILHFPEGEGEYLHTHIRRA